MTTRTSGLGLAAAALSLFLVAPATFAAPATAPTGPNDVTPDRDASDRGATVDPDRTPSRELPTDRPIVATVIDIDQTAGTVMLSTPHGDVAVSVAPEVAERLNIGDVVVVRITDEQDSPSASPRDEPGVERPRI